MGEPANDSIEQQAKPKRHGGNPAWVKGVSGNPGGRKALPDDIVRLCQKHAPAAIRKLVEIAASKSPVAIRACEVILNRAYGTAPQSLKIMGDDANPLVLEIRANAEQLRQRMLGIAGRQ